jgi:CPA2 family monovalent cation:H+ antiporter-2
MVLTPVLVGLAPHFTAGERLLAPLARLIGDRGIEDEDTGEGGFTDHVVIVGYGVAGRLVAKALQSSDIPYAVLELNAESVRAARARGEPVFYADATSAEALTHAHIAQARAVVLLISDPQGVQRIVDTVRRLSAAVPILVRTHYLAEKPAVMKLGATDAVADEVEGGVEVLARLFRWLEVPRNEIDDRVHEIREQTQSTERTQTVPRKALSDHSELAELKIESVKIGRESFALGRSPAELDVRRESGALIVAVRRNGILLEQPNPAAPFENGDIIYLVGSLGAVQSAITLLTRVPAAADAS